MRRERASTKVEYPPYLFATIWFRLSFSTKDGTMTKEVIDLNDSDDDPVVVVRAHITHITVRNSAMSTIHFVGGAQQSVKGSVSEIVQKIWPLGG